jgi:hypothetical protein
LSVAVADDGSDRVFDDLTTVVLNGLDYNGVDIATNAYSLNLIVLPWEATSTHPFNTDLLELANPEVVFLMLRPESIVRAIGELEAGLDRSPFYVLGPDLLDAPSTLSAIETFGIEQRALGVSWAEVGDAATLQGYRSRFQGRYFDLPIERDGAPAHYDAAYYAMYALAGSAEVAPKAEQIAEGMLRLGASEPIFAVGPSGVSDAIARLTRDRDGALQLGGASGSTVFDADARVRRMASRVWCVRHAEEVLEFVEDELQYDSESDTLVGTTPCVPGF